MIWGDLFSHELFKSPYVFDKKISIPKEIRKKLKFLKHDNINVKIKFRHRNASLRYRKIERLKNRNEREFADKAKSDLSLPGISIIESASTTSLTSFENDRILLTEQLNFCNISD